MPGRNGVGIIFGLSYSFGEGHQQLLLVEVLTMETLYYGKNKDRLE